MNKDKGTVGSLGSLSIVESCLCWAAAPVQRNQVGPYNILAIFLQYIKPNRANERNIARGTTDPDIDSVTWIKLGNNMAPLTLVANLATRWRHLH